MPDYSGPTLMPSFMHSTLIIEPESSALLIKIPTIGHDPGAAYPFSVLSNYFSKIRLNFDLFLTLF
jgi:hypothetical protein